MADRTPNDLADALPPVCPTCGSDTPTTYFGSCFDNQHSTIFDPRLPLDPWHAYMAELAHLRRQVDSLNAYVGVGQELLQKAEAKVRVQGEQLDTLRAERDALLKAARAVAFCGGCGELPHDPNDECWYYDRSDCEYALRRGICSFDCHEEPSCMTDGPWPMEELRQLLAAAVPQDPGTSATTGRTATRSTPRVTCR